jgi:AraC-like DNA-binding protein
MDEYARLPFTVYGAYSIQHPAGYIQKEYTLNASSFIFALSGDATIYQNDESFAYTTGRVIHCAPGRRFNATNGRERSAELIELIYHYDGPYADYMHIPYALDIGINPRLFSMLLELRTLRENPSAQAHLRERMLVYSVLSEMFSSARSVLQTNANSIVGDAKAYLEQHYMDHHSLCELGGRYGMCGKYFSDVFRKYVGIGPIEYLIDYRMQQARKLIEYTECSVREIGINVGYKDSKSFSRQFRKIFGISPNGLRGHISGSPIRK